MGATHWREADQVPAMPWGRLVTGARAAETRGRSRTPETPLMAGGTEGSGRIRPFRPAAAPSDSACRLFEEACAQEVPPQEDSSHGATSADETPRRRKGSQTTGLAMGSGPPAPRGFVGGSLGRQHSRWRPGVHL